MALNPALMSMIRNAKNKYSRSNTGKAQKPKEGKTRYRILQASPDQQFWADLGVHWIKPDKNSKPMVVIGDTDIVYGRPSAINIAIEKAMQAATDDESLDIIKSWKARPSVLVAALVRSGPDANEDEPIILELTPTTFGQILSMIEEYAADYGNILDPESGIDFIIERKGKGLDTEYTVLPSFKAEPVKKAALERMPDLMAYIESNFFRDPETKALSAIAQLTGISVKALSGPGAGGTKALTSAAAHVDDIDLEAYAPPARAAAPKSRKTVRTEPDPADDVIEEAPWDDDEPAPASKAAKASRRAPDAGDEFGADMDDSEIDDILSELDDVG